MQNIDHKHEGSQFVFHCPARLENVNGGKKIVPIRPVACLSGGLDLEDSATVRLLWEGSVWWSVWRVSRSQFDDHWWKNTTWPNTCIWKKHYLFLGHANHKKLTDWRYTFPSWIFRFWSAPLNIGAPIGLSQGYWKLAALVLGMSIPSFGIDPWGRWFWEIDLIPNLGHHIAAWCDSVMAGKQ